MFLPSGVIDSGIPAIRLWAYFISVMRATRFAHLVLESTNHVFRPPRHWIIVSRIFLGKILVIFSMERIIFDVLDFRK